MAAERVFLGWDQPLLPAAVAWYRTRFADAPVGEGSSPVPSSVRPLVVLPTRQAERRWLEATVEAGGGTATPPDTVTLGRLPERLFTPERAVAEPIVATAVRAHQLREAARAGSAGIAALIPRPPASDDVPGWWRLAGVLASLSSELAAAGLDVTEATPRVERRGVDPRASARWSALAELDTAYHAALAARGVTDAQAARLAAVREGRCRFDRPLVLVGLDDLTPLAAAMVRSVESPVTALVHAPASEAESFDDLGVLRVEAWRDRDPGLGDAALRLVNTPGEQALAAAAAIESAAEAWRQRGEALTPARVTIGLADAALAGPVRRALEAAGVETREAEGRPMTQAPPATLLRAVADYVASRRLDALAALLRHADVEQYLLRDTGTAYRETDSPLTDLDAYLTDHLQRDASRDWLGKPERRGRLDALQSAVDRLVPDGHAAARALPAWDFPIRSLLTTVYADRAFVEHRPTDDATARPLQALGRVLEAHARLDASDDATPRVDFATALRLTVESLEGQRTPEAAGRDAVELRGLLELPTDDAAVMVVVGANEGRWPVPPASLPWLPESLRGPLGLVDRERRLAREKYRLLAMRHCRPHLTVIAGRWSSRGDPLAPSRVLLSDDDAQAAAVMRRFYGVGGATPEPGSEADTLPELHVGDSRDGFLLPYPVDVQPIDRLAVTGFRDYLACPYRFFLKRVLKLEPVDDAAVELTPLAFGSLAHDVLQRFAEERGVVHSASFEAIETCLLDTLASLVRSRYGAQLRPAVQLQRAALEDRLRSFAVCQAQLTREGWLIDADRVERDFKHTLTIDGKPFTITGRIDRVDRHADTAAVRVIDYKTGDSAKTPARVHRVQGEWVDLQLPIYRDLAEPLGIVGEGEGERVEVGFFNLPKRASDVRLELASRWGEADYDEARETRDAVVRAIRDDLTFWPPSEPPAFADEFTRLCLDAVTDRRFIVQRSEREATR